MYNGLTTDLQKYRNNIEDFANNNQQARKRHSTNAWAIFSGASLSSFHKFTAKLMYAGGLEGGLQYLVKPINLRYELWKRLST